MARTTRSPPPRTSACTAGSSARSCPLLTAVAFFSISVWSSGDALVGGAHRLFGLEQSTLSYVVAYALFAVLVLAVCVYGFRFMLFVNKIAVMSATVLFLLGAIAFAGDFDPSYAGVFTSSADAATQSLFWPSFIGAALIVLSNPVSFGAFLGDWSRYIPANTPRRKVVGAAFLSQIATLLPFVFGLATASIIASKAPQYVDPGAPDFVGGLLAISPSWFFLPVCLLALIGGMSTGTTSLYGTGLDFSSVFPGCHGCRRRSWSVSCPSRSSSSAGSASTSCSRSRRSPR